MRYAIAVEGGQVSGHFGRCERFLLVDIEDGQVQGREEMPCPAHQPGALPRLMVDKGVDVVVCGGLGPRAQEMLADWGVQVLAGVSASVEEAIAGLTSGTLAVGQSTCDH